MESGELRVCSRCQCLQCLHYCVRVHIVQTPSWYCADLQPEGSLAGHACPTTRHFRHLDSHSNIWKVTHTGMEFRLLLRPAPVCSFANPDPFLRIFLAPTIVQCWTVGLLYSSMWRYYISMKTGHGFFLVS